MPCTLRRKALMQMLAEATKQSMTVQSALLPGLLGCARIVVLWLLQINCVWFYNVQLPTHLNSSMLLHALEGPMPCKHAHHMGSRESDKLPMQILKSSVMTTGSTARFWAISSKLSWYSSPMVTQLYSVTRLCNVQTHNALKGYECLERACTLHRTHATRHTLYAVSWAQGPRGRPSSSTQQLA